MLGNAAPIVKSEKGGRKAGAHLALPSNLNLKRV
jgi:hypothetical protein